MPASEKHVGIFAVCMLLALQGFAPESRSQESEISTSGISGDAEKPRRHVRIKNARALSRSEATRIYSLISDALNKGYASSGLPAIDQYQRLQKFNEAPYISSSHGNQYLNNYANEAGKAYGKFEQSGVLPVGTVLYKDSFTVESNRQIILGPLFLMEKMPVGFNRISNDWKYTQIQPTGEVLGETNGINSDRVNYCIECHITRSKEDQLFFIPADYRVSK